MGKFIVFEGIDGSGTTTVSQRVAEELQASWTCEPSGSEIGKLLRKVLKGEVGPYDRETLMHLFRADRIEHAKEIGEQLDSGLSVVCDRYYASTYVYQSICADFETSAMMLKHLCNIGLKHDILTLPVPSATFFLDASVDTAAERRLKREGEEEIFDSLRSQHIVKYLYKKYFASSKSSHAVIDAEKSIEDCVEQCLRYLGGGNCDNAELSAG